MDINPLKGLLTGFFPDFDLSKLLFDPLKLLGKLTDLDKNNKISDISGTATPKLPDIYNSKGTV